MYKEKISAWVDAHKDEMLEDICELCRVNSEKMPAEEDMPLGICLPTFTPTAPTILPQRCVWPGSSG